MNKLYVLIYTIIETRKLLSEDELDQQCIINEIDGEDNQFEDITCTLQIYKLENSEFKPLKEFDVEFFQDILSDKEDLEEYLNLLEESICNGQIPENIINVFQ
jgi:hypothetical protein